MVTYIIISIWCKSLSIICENLERYLERTAFNFCCEHRPNVLRDWLDWPNGDFGIIIGILIQAKIFKLSYFRTCYSLRRSHHLCLLLIASIPCGLKPSPNTGQRNANRLMRDLSTSLPFDSDIPAPLLARISIVFVHSEIIIHLYVLECSTRNLQSL